MREIHVAGGHVAIVDDEDYEELSKHSWKITGGYVGRNEKIKGEKREDRKDRYISMSRSIMNFPKGKVVDHINGNVLDNRRSNLRVCTHGQNTMNRGMHKNNTSGFKGVTFNKASMRWQAVITANGKHYYLGLFDSPEGAHEAYKEKAIELHGEFTNLGVKQ